MNRKIYLYVKAFSDLGSFMDLIAINVLIYAATGSSSWLAATMAIRTLGGVLSSLFSGVVADRFDRRKIMIYTDIFRAVIILFLIPFPNPVMIIVVCFFIGLTSSFFAVSYSAEIPQIFGQKKVLETNALIARLTSISLVGGFIGAGIITDFLGNKVTLLVDAGTYILSALVLLKMKWESTSANNLAFSSGVKQKFITIGTDLKEVYSFIMLAPMLLLVNIVFLVGAFAGASHNLGIPLLAEKIDATKQSFYYGMIWGVWGVGSVLSTMILPKLKWLNVGNRIYYACFIGVLLMSTGFITFLSNTNLWVVLPFAFFTGIFDACFTTLHATILQKTENHIRGRIFGVGMLLKSLGFALGFVVAPFVLENLSLAKMVWVFHGSLISTTILVIVYSSRFVRKQRVEEVSQGA
ncbi:MAG TPA: MFS transporter [Pseudoneobacillus sp.]|nr:MFS transporter [Pseudoneobacillus sp.]